jgi:hypothetical protein
MAYMETVSLYRIDLMRDVALTDYALDGREPGFDARRFVKDAVYAFAGEPEEITLRCDRGILGHVIDKFGTDIRVRETDGDKLEIRLSVAPDGVKFWALQFLPYVEVLKPARLREEIIESVRGNPYGE